MGRMNAHDRVVTKAAYEPGFLAIVGTEGLVVGHTISKREPRANCGPIKPTGKVDPFAAIATPRLTAVGDENVALDQRLLEFSKMLAEHGRRMKVERRSATLGIARDD